MKLSKCKFANDEHHYSNYVVGKSGIKMDHAEIEPSLIRIRFMMLDYCIHFWGCVITSYDLFKNILL